MTEALADLLQVSQAVFLAGVLVFLRVGAVLALLPAFGEVMVPVRVKLAIAACLTILVTPLTTPSVETTSYGPTVMLGAGLAEIAVGLILGFGLRLFVFALQIAGTIAAQSTSLSQLLGSQAVDPQPALGVVLVIAGLALATSLGLHVRVASMLAQTYVLVPPGTLLPVGPMTEWVIDAVAHAFRLAVTLASPFVLASLLYNLALGVINRAMPQLMVAFVGAPAITFGALVLLALTAPLILSIWVTALNQRLANPWGIF